MNDEEDNLKPISFKELSDVDVIKDLVRLLRALQTGAVQSTHY